MRQRATVRGFVLSSAFVTVSAAILISAFAAGSIRAQSSHNTAAIEGVVVGPEAKPVAGARVFLQPSDGRVPRVALTDSQGHYRFHALRQDFYDVRAQLNGRTSEWTRNVNLRSGAQVTVNLKLKPAQPVSTAPQK